jgi:hypothetical protein
VSDAVFGAVLAPSQSHYLIHLFLVSFQGGEVVSEHQKIRRLQLKFEGTLKSTLGFGEAVEKK